MSHDVCVSCSVMSDSATPWTVARQAPLPTGFSRQDFRSRLSFPSLGHLPNLGYEPASPVSPLSALQANSLLLSHRESPTQNEKLKKINPLFMILKVSLCKLRKHIMFESESHSVVCDSLQPHRLYNPWNSLG